MIGSNTLILNVATVTEAIQEYLDKRMFKYSPKVVSVTLENITVTVKVVSIAEEDKYDSIRG
jgi:hypothetical protein